MSEKAHRIHRIRGLLDPPHRKEVAGNPHRTRRDKKAVERAKAASDGDEAGSQFRGTREPSRV